MCGVEAKCGPEYAYTIIIGHVAGFLTVVWKKRERRNKIHSKSASETKDE